MSDQIQAMRLTTEQQDTVNHYREFDVPAQWFVGTTASTSGAVEVIALGANFVWSFLIERDGSAATSEAKLGDFSTGIEV